MKRAKRTKTAKAPPLSSGQVLDLSVPFHTRISAHAMELIKAGAVSEHTKTATHGRNLLYRALGIIKPSKGS
jgi:hypothetical protein